jgi:hypothetical protein
MCVCKALYLEGRVGCSGRDRNEDAEINGSSRVLENEYGVIVKIAAQRQIAGITVSRNGRLMLWTTAKPF